mmetsp:Transcript_2740/g.4685  ORF Transcript_2740/g.4685 Transcript_2740/m.4685 type:complete len:128 (+) Transcript_2740:430-813(+)
MNTMNIGSEGKKWAFQGRIKNHAEPYVINEKENVPGPGHYEPGMDINKLGVYSLSTISNSRAAAWSPSKKRFVDQNKHKAEIPGPGEYNPSDYNAGSYILSNFKNYGSIRIKGDNNNKFRNNRTLHN